MMDGKDEYRTRRLQRVGYGLGGGLVVGTAVWTLSGAWWWLAVFLAIGLLAGLFLSASTPRGG